MAALHHPGAGLASRPAARHAADSLKDEPPGLAGTGGVGGQKAADKADSPTSRRGVKRTRELADLLPIRPMGNASAEPGVLASALHMALGLRKDFSNWAKAAITRAMLVDGIDFILIRPERRIKMHGGDRRSRDWVLSLTAAKHVALMSATQRGAEVRHYFIATERRLRELQAAGMADAAMLCARAQLDRKAIEAAGSQAGRVLGRLRAARKANDALMLQAAAAWSQPLLFTEVSE